MKLTKILLLVLALVAMLAMAACDQTPDEPPVDTTCTHEYGETVNAKYLNSAATCEAPATYFKSCTKCGEATTETFVYGETASHTFKEIVEDEHIKIPADCSYGAEYYYTCTVCGAHSEDTFTSGDPLEHDYQQIRDDKFKITGESCTTAAKYYVSCVHCKTKGRETFTVGTPAGHQMEFHDEVAPTTTAHGHVAYYECTVCGFFFNDEEGKQQIATVPQTHAVATFYDESDGKHYKACQMAGCDYRECEAEHTYAGDCDHKCQDCDLPRETTVEHVDANTDGLCDVCGETLPDAVIPDLDDLTPGDSFDD